MTGGFLWVVYAPVEEWKGFDDDLSKSKDLEDKVPTSSKIKDQIIIWPKKLESPHTYNQLEPEL
jgi:hypothetical protein